MIAIRVHEILKQTRKSFWIQNSSKEFFATSCFLFFYVLPGIFTRMRERKIISVILLTTFTFLLLVEVSLSCNQMLCASIVSKCMLTQSCKCELKNCTCCSDCVQCLSWLWDECCSCVGKFINMVSLEIVFMFDFHSRFVSKAQ